MGTIGRRGHKIVHTLPSSRLRPKQMAENQQEILLLREASMAAMSIGHGLTQLRKYDFGQAGLFYSSLLQLTSGIERLLKLIVIYAHRLSHSGSFPNNKELKNYGHNLEELFSKSLVIAKDFGCENLSLFYSQDEIVNKILILLSDFALQARYYNLDTLTGRQQRNGIEPLSRWETEINNIILKRHFRPRKETIAQWKYIIKELEGNSYTQHITENGLEINSFRGLANHGMLVPTKQKYSMYYVYTIIRYLCQLLKFLECKGNYYPYLRENFVIFEVEERNYILQKKSWNPLPPYKF